MSTVWSQLPPIDYETIANPIKLDDHRFAIMPHVWSRELEEGVNGIFAYDTRSNKLVKIIDYPSGVTITYHEAVYHEQKNTTYILGLEKKLLAFDLTDEKCECLEEGIKGSDKGNPKLILIDDEIHIFGSTSSTYAIYDCNQKALTDQPSPDANHQFHNYPFMYLKSQNIVLFFNYDKNQIISYSFANRSWGIKNVAMATPFRTISTIYDEYILCKYHSDSSGCANYVMAIYNVSDGRFLDVDPPIPVGEDDDIPGNAECDAKGIIMDNKELLLTIGYVRASALSIPGDVMSIILNFVECQDFLYMIDFSDSGAHWKIGLDVILPVGPLHYW